MSLLTLARTNITVTNRESASPVLSYALYVLISFILVGLVLAPALITNSNGQVYALAVFVSILFLYDYFPIIAKLRGLSLIDRFAFLLFPISRTRSFASRLFLFIADKRVSFYLVPLLGIEAFLAREGSAAGVLLMLLLFISIYLAMSEIFFLLYAILRKLADRFSVRAVTQFSGVLFLLSALLINAFAHGETDMLTMVPVLSQFIKAFQAILSSHFKAASIETGYLLAFVCGIALSVSVVAYMYDKTAAHLRTQFAPRSDRRKERELDPFDVKGSETGREFDRITETTSTAKKTLAHEDLAPARQIARHLAIMDWLIHQREEKILYLLLLYPLLMIFAIVRLTPRFHFEHNSLIFPIFFLTPLLGFYFTENHFTAHGLRLSHLVLSSLNPYKFVFAKTISTWGLLSLMNLFVCVFCGLYLSVTVYAMVPGMIYSLLLPLVLLQLANSISLYFPSSSRHPLISLLIIVFSELVATGAYVLIMQLSLVIGTLVVLSTFYLSFVVSMPAWGRQLGKQLQILLEHQK